MDTRYFWHGHRATKDVLFARVCGEAIDILALDAYPEQDYESAIEWLKFTLDGLAMCSEFEWWSCDMEDADNWFKTTTGKAPAGGVLRMVSGLFDVANSR